MVSIRHLEGIIMVAGIFLIAPAFGKKGQFDDDDDRTIEGTTESTGDTPLTNDTFLTNSHQPSSTSEPTVSISRFKEKISRISYQAPVTYESTRTTSVTKETVSKSLQRWPSTSSPAPQPVQPNPSGSAYSTPSRSTPTSPPTTPSSQGEIKESFDLKINRKFTQDLLDNSSKSYKDLEEHVVGNLTEVLNDLDGFDRVEVERFLPGSVIASSSAYFSAGSSSRHSIRSTLDQAQQKGALSSLGVSEIKYREEPDDRREPNESGTSTLTYVLIAVGVVAGIALCVFVVSKVRTKAGQAGSKQAKKNKREPEEIKADGDSETAKPL